MQHNRKMVSYSNLKLIIVTFTGELDLLVLAPVSTFERARVEV
jgi:hypothetical protein